MDRLEPIIRTSHHKSDAKGLFLKSHVCPEQTIKMTKPFLTRDSLYYRGSCTSQFLDCNRVGGQGAEEEEKREEEKKQRRGAAELHNRATADRRASVMD